MASDDLINTSIDEYLISLANSINHAQRYISQLRIAGQENQPSITYQLPRVEFELKVQFQLNRKHPASGGRQRDIAKGEGGAFLGVRPLGSDASDAGTSTAAASTIKGSFVAVPIHGGTPPPVVTIDWKHLEAEGRYTITVTVRSNIDEALPGREVQFNVDKDLAGKLNPLWSLETDLTKILPNTRLFFGVQLTDGEGQATNELLVGDLNAKVPIVIDVLGITKTIVFGGAGSDEGE